MKRRELEKELLVANQKVRAYEEIMSKKTKYLIVYDRPDEPNMMSRSEEIDAHFMNENDGWLIFTSYSGNILKCNSRSIVYGNYERFYAETIVIRKINKNAIVEIIKDYKDVSKGLM